MSANVQQGEEDWAGNLAEEFVMKQWIRLLYKANFVFGSAGTFVMVR